MSLVLDLQSPEGEIYWAVDSDKGVSRDALITGCSSIYKSLQCTAAIAETIGRDPQPWLTARQRLGDAVRNKPHLFDRTWAPKARYSMDWFYPVLSGIVRGEAAELGLDARRTDRARSRSRTRGASSTSLWPAMLPALGAPCS